MRKAIYAFIVVASICGPARGNDSTAELATGGLKFVMSPDIEMRSEDLFVSTSQIRVRYRFFNTSPKDITTLVAFPMPDVTISGPDDNIAIPTQNPENILDFHTVANGGPVVTRVEQRAIAQGVDRTELLGKLSIPLAPQLAATGQALDRLPRAQSDQLIRLGLADIEEFDAGKGMERRLEARWTLKTTYYWEQTFPAQRELLIEHRYTPSVGSSVATALGEEWGRDQLPKYKEKYCVDAAFLAAVDRARRSRAGQQPTLLSEQRIQYILKTGANWDGPIKNFHLVVDKGDVNALVSFCGEGVKKIGPTQFEVRATDFTPDGDLNVLLLSKPQG